MPMKNKSLYERCTKSFGKGEDGFVGIKIKKDDVEITFPLGYDLQKAEDNVIRKEILSLLHILQKFNIKKISEPNKTDKSNATLEFPLLSYQHIILDFFANGYYSEKEVSYNSAIKGKINWKRTIQKKKPYISNKSAVYLDFIVKKNVINENTMITRIHEFCVYQSFMKLGWLYTDMSPTKPRIKFNKKMFIATLNHALTQTFNDSKRQLFIAMLNIVHNVNEGDALTSESSFGTTSFEYVWEKMIDYVFGEDNKEIYFPKARWRLVRIQNSIQSSSLQPDTIIKQGDKVYIIDAKYYKYGITNNPTDLPSSSSIQKQITYGEYLTSDKFREVSGQAFLSDNIYNAFVMPFDKSKNSDEDYKFIGIATADWKDSNKNYEKVAGLLLDTKHLISNCYKQNGKEIEKISEMIEEFIKEDIDE